MDYDNVNFAYMLKTILPNVRTMFIDREYTLQSKLNVEYQKAIDMSMDEFMATQVKNGNDISRFCGYTTYSGNDVANFPKLGVIYISKPSKFGNSSFVEADAKEFVAYAMARNGERATFEDILFTLISSKGFQSAKMNTNLTGAPDELILERFTFDSLRTLPTHSHLSSRIRVVRKEEVASFLKSNSTIQVSKSQLSQIDYKDRLCRHFYVHPGDLLIVKTDSGTLTYKQLIKELRIVVDKSLLDV